ncbi:hypothetical protein Clacol_005167 [Clathrus columnatus]|uniref:L-lysine 6-oxidase n=1 Tax=Clathrus columnatus TaxID=1419009 RepID=A0AAV5ABT2_9AGAM|nr:hypothetical protein Clacol_005167 [Clathrus columnatus]
MPIQPNDIHQIEIFPPIAVARLGNASPDTYYIGLEVPDVEHLPPPLSGLTKKFRDENDCIRRQAARFHAYAFDSKGKVLGELTKVDGYELKWNVSVANKKSAWVRFRVYEETYKLHNPAVQPYKLGPTSVYDYTNERDKLIISATGSLTSTHDPKDFVTLNGIFDGGLGSDKSITLGHLSVDEKGSLIFVVGDGDSQCMAGKNYPLYPDLTEKFDSEYWYDCTCNGDITLTVEHSGFSSGPKSALHKATITTAPPKFTPGLSCVGSLYDVIEDVYERPKHAALGKAYDCGTVGYYQHIKPLFNHLFLMSWTNQKLYQGHGPHKLPHFKDELLKEPSVDNQPIRQAIFACVRAPVNPDDPQDPYIRNAQAYEYYMPRLSGNAGNNPEPPDYNDTIRGRWDYISGENLERPADPKNNRARWSSLTELQHDRLSKWAKGDFITGLPPDNRSKYTDYPVDQQPTILSCSALQWTTGVPLYPGIEAYWIVESSDIYEPRNEQDPVGIFRLKKEKAGNTTADSIKYMKPGDLTKGLSLPWQADFYMWPHVRPDDIITQKMFDDIRKELNDDKVLPFYLTIRELWHCGFKTDPNDERVGATNMVKNWTQLGFISQVPNIKSSMPIYIETERLVIPKPGPAPLATVQI